MTTPAQLFIDTTGWAFGYPLAWKAGARVSCYVHYPTISSDMLARVWRGTVTYNNDARIAGGWAAMRIWVRRSLPPLFACCLPSR